MATFQNKATLSYNGVTIDSNTVTGEIPETLSVYKTSLYDSYANEAIVYIVTLVNAGDADLTGVTLTDDLGGYEIGVEPDLQTVYPLSFVGETAKYFLDGVPQPDLTAQVADGAVIAGITVPANGSATIVYSALPNEYAPREAGGEIVNTVEASGGAESASASAALPVENGPILSIFKSVSSPEARESRTLEYSFLIENAGNGAAEADASVVVSDLFDPILHGLTAALDGVPMSAGTGYEYNESTGLFKTVPGAITVPAATVSVDPETGAYTVVPGSVTLTVGGTV